MKTNTRPSDLCDGISELFEEKIKQMMEKHGGTKFRGKVYKLTNFTYKITKSAFLKFINI